MASISEITFYKYISTGSGTTGTWSDKPSGAADNAGYYVTGTSNWSTYRVTPRFASCVWKIKVTPDTGKYVTGLSIKVSAITIPKLTFSITPKFKGQILTSPPTGTTGPFTPSSGNASAEVTCYNYSSSGAQTQADVTFTWTGLSLQAGYYYIQWYSNINYAIAQFHITRGTNTTANWSTGTVNSQAANSYYIHYNANGGTGAPSNTTFVYGSGAKLSTTVPTRSGYRFTGWLIAGTGGRVLQPGATIPTGWLNIDATAQWIQTYEIKYANGGHGTAPSTQIKDHGASITLAAAITTTDKASGGTDTFTLTGNANGGTWSGTNGNAKTTYTYGVYTFKNWKSSYSNTTFNAGGTYSTNASTTMTAQWNTGTKTYANTSTTTLPTGTPTKASSTGTKATYTVTGNANGGTWSGSNGSASKTPVTSYSFSGWYTATSGGTKITTSTNFKAAATVYAQYSSSTSYNYTYTLPTGTPTKASTTKSTYTVTFNAGGGSVSTASATSNIPVSYTFSGWYTAATGGTKRTTSSQISANETVYAQYTSSDGTRTAVTLPTPTRSGYNFSGWYTAASGGTKIGNAGESYTPSADITIYAQWIVDVVTITLDANGGTGGTASVSMGGVTSKANFPAITLPVKTGYSFMGYFTTAADGIQYYDASGHGARDLNVASDQTWYAHWLKSGCWTYIKVNGEWKLAISTIKDATYKLVYPWMKTSNTWK